ncbi:MAG TPA: translation factor GTPase family protein [Streptosporangiaceae bacterium]|nr:translation factor GTPase family protein [Streptosporangiaceae bacterium]
MRTLNLGILAHVDAGKTTLTERLLFAAGVIDEVGSVDDGSTQTDSLALERQRGITIKSAVVSFAVDDVTVNLIDTPGHPDFIAEVERVLGVLDGAVLVVSAVEGVQAQTVVLMRTLQRLGIPTLIFVNKIDRAGADGRRVLHQISQRLSPAVVAMGWPRGQGTRGAGLRPYGAGDPDFTARLAEVLADRDDALLADYVDNETGLSFGRLSAALAAQSRRGLVHPVFFGSAVTGAGVDRLTAGITGLLPAVDTKAEADGPVSAAVFKVGRGPAGEKIAYVRMFAGTLHARERVNAGRDGEAKVTAISVFDRGLAAPSASVAAGQIGKVWGLAGIQVGDTLGDPAATSARHHVARHHFAPPTLETVVVPARPADRAALHAALVQLAEQDPLINLRQDDVRAELLVSLYGEVQKEVIQATLADEFGLAAGFKESTTICIERPVGTGSDVEFMGGANLFRATVGLRVDPAALGSGVAFRREIELGALTPAFLKAIEETVRQTLTQGLSGWEVTDVTVTLTHSGYTPPPPYGWSKWSSSAGDFRNLTPLVLMSALSQAGTAVFEPMHQFTLEIPADTLGAVLPVLARLRAIPLEQDVRGRICAVAGDIPAAHVHQLQQHLPALTRGEGVLASSFDHYQPAGGEIPARPRSDRNPLNRKEYLLRVARGVAGP